jgi:predicted enzyme related to lactoylglutathione lyase
VGDVTATVATVGHAGGTVLVGPLDVPGEAGSMAVCQDTEGALFAVWRLIYGPVDIPIARMAVVLDPQGANVALLESRYPEPR